MIKSQISKFSRRSGIPPRAGKSQNKGIALILTLLILTGLLALALGISTLIIREIKLSQEIANSVVAYGAADTGIERFMYGVNQEDLVVESCCCTAGSGCTTVQNCYTATFSDSNNASYVVCTKQVLPAQIKSTGTFGSTNRSIQINY